MKLKTISFILVSLLFAGSATAQENGRKKGINLFQAGSYSEAASILRTVVETDNNDVIAWKYLGASLVKLGNEKDARAAFRKVPYGSKKSAAAENALFDSPPKVTYKKPARYTAAARQENIQGEVLLAVELRADGTIGFVFPIRTLPSGLTESAISQARAIRFEPATITGQPVTEVRIFSYTFRIF